MQGKKVRWGVFGAFWGWDSPPYYRIRLGKLKRRALTAPPLRTVHAPRFAAQPNSFSRAPRVKPAFSQSATLREFH